jgi:hypothetical protein
MGRTQAAATFIDKAAKSTLLVTARQRLEWAPGQFRRGNLRRTLVENKIVRLVGQQLADDPADLVENGRPTWLPLFTSKAFTCETQVGCRNRKTQLKGDKNEVRYSQL